MRIGAKNSSNMPASLGIIIGTRKTNNFFCAYAHSYKGSIRTRVFVLLNEFMIVLVPSKKQLLKWPFAIVSGRVPILRHFESGYGPWDEVEQTTNKH